MNKLDKPFDFKSDKPLKKTHLELFRRLENRPNAGPIRQKLLILCTPRSGSTLFAEALSNSGEIGVCEEWLNYEYFAAYMKVTGKKFILRDYLNWIARKTVGNTGVLAFKAHVAQLFTVYKDFGLGIASLQFDHVVYLSRLNKIAQAVSLAKAINTNQFRYNEKSEHEPVIGMHAIVHALGIIIEQEEYFYKVLRGYAKAIYFYEDFVTLEDKSYNEVLTTLDKPRQDSFRTTLKKQANEDSKKLEQNFRAYLKGTCDA